MKNMKCSHKFSHYFEALEKAKNLSYHFLRLCDFREIIEHKKLIVLRHDIDLSLKNALKIAHLEHELGIQSTYFIRVSAKYNIMFYPNIKIIQEIKSLGHEIGLHYSLDIPKLINSDQITYLIKEKRILEEIIQQEIKGICLHDPNSKRGIDIELSEYNLIYDAYSNSFMDELKYISDSRASWREGCMCKNIGKHNKLYILTHPFWWYEDASCENF
jgi:hypothetical protein